MIIQKQLNFNDHFLNLIFSKTIAFAGFKFSVLILVIIMEGTSLRIVIDVWVSFL